MTRHFPPNRFVAFAEGTTQLDYTVNLSPSPWTASVPNEPPELASVQIVITNPTQSTLTVSTITFTFPVGVTNAVTPSVAGVTCTTSDNNSWSFSGPPANGPASSATFTVAPAGNSSGALAENASFSVYLYQIPTMTSPGSASVSVVETLQGDLDPGTYSFTIATLPAGFFFEGLVATVDTNGTYTPVAEVASGTVVTLFWSSSVIAPGSFQIYYSGGTGPATPTESGQWSTPSGIVDDTVFTVILDTTDSVGEPVQAVLSTAVTVSGSATTVASISTNAITITNTNNYPPITIDTEYFSGTITSNIVNVETGGLSAPFLLGKKLYVGGTTWLGKFPPAGEVTTDTLRVYGGATITGTLTASDLSFNSISATTETVTYLTVQTQFQAMSAERGSWRSLAAGAWQATTDSLVMGIVSWPEQNGSPDPQPGSVAWAAASWGTQTVWATGGNLGAFGPNWADCQLPSSNSFLLPVPANMPFLLSEFQAPYKFQQANANISFFWFPLGAQSALSGGDSVTYTGVQPANPAAVANTSWGLIIGPSGTGAKGSDGGGTGGGGTGGGGSDGPTTVYPVGNALALGPGDEGVNGFLVVGGRGTAASERNRKLSAFIDRFGAALDKSFDEETRAKLVTALRDAINAK